uniref:DekiORF28 n=1 Tax=Dendrolimus kikuchii nucleopolyhedrovirus TaxID=1219875 RepID=V9LSM4_9ABAC|nr:DekiORF28 [Dendrolimus kikuchii nucleopolyhedrovirus]
MPDNKVAQETKKLTVPHSDTAVFADEIAAQEALDRFMIECLKRKKRLERSRSTCASAPALLLPPFNFDHSSVVQLQSLLDSLAEDRL